MSTEQFDPSIYDLDTAALLAGLGVEPRMVKPDTVNLFIREGKVLCEYQVIRAVPPHVLGMALMAASSLARNGEPEDSAQTEDVEQPESGQTGPVSLVAVAPPDGDDEDGHER